LQLVGGIYLAEESCIQQAFHAARKNEEEGFISAKYAVSKLFNKTYFMIP
jgi:hypothetical protein